MNIPESGIFRIEAVDNDAETSTAENGFPLPPVCHLWDEDRLFSCRAATGQQLAAGDWIQVELRDDGCYTVIDKISPLQHRNSNDLRLWSHPRPADGMSRINLLRMRRDIRRLWEDVFAERGYLQLEMPVLLPAVNPEAQLGIIPADAGFLSTSPELQMKRMICGGFKKIMSIGPCFRADETDRFHNPEFTMAEWYCRGGSLEMLAEDLEEFFVKAAGKWPALNSRLELVFDDKKIDLTPPWPRCSVSELIKRECGVDISGTVTARQLLQRINGKISLPPDAIEESYEQLFSRLWENIEAKLACQKPLFITDWPAPLASLARLKPDDPTVAQRMELVIGGVELANGFAELTDPQQNRERFADSVKLREQSGLPQVRPDEKFLAAVAAGMPPTAGIAAGFDRICQFLTGSCDIRGVLPFAADEL